MSTRDEYEEFAVALAQTQEARACIGQNRGYEREQAREAYECAVGEMLVPALLKAIEAAAGDVEARDIERLANLVARWLTKHELITDEGGST
jgi:hypothetical protein